MEEDGFGLREFWESLDEKQRHALLALRRVREKAFALAVCVCVGIRIPTTPTTTPGGGPGLSRMRYMANASLYIHINTHIDRHCYRRRCAPASSAARARTCCFSPSGPSSEVRACLYMCLYLHHTHTVTGMDGRPHHSIHPSIHPPTDRSITTLSHAHHRPTNPKQAKARGHPQAEEAGGSPYPPAARAARPLPFRA